MTFVRRKRKMRPTHPGAMIREDFLPEFGLNATRLATALGVSRQTMNELLGEKRAVSPPMALRLARLFGNSPEFWLQAQHAVDLYEAEQQFQRELDRIVPVHAA